MEDNPLTVVTVGSVWSDDYKTETLSPEGNSIRVQVEDKQKGTKITIDSAGNIDLGENATQGVARLNDATKSTSVEDNVYWTWMNSFVTAVAEWANGANSGATPNPTLAATILAWQTANPIPSSLTGKITSSSNTVKAKD